MSSRLERERVRVFDTDSPLKKHSLNQRNLKSSFEGDMRIYRVPKKELKSHRRRQRRIKRALNLVVDEFLQNGGVNFSENPDRHIVYLARQITKLTCNVGL